MPPKDHPPSLEPWVRQDPERYDYIRKAGERAELSPEMIRAAQESYAHQYGRYGVFASHENQIEGFRFALETPIGTIIREMSL